MSVIQFPKSSRAQAPQPTPAPTTQQLISDCALELSGFMLDEERAKAAYRVLNRFDVAEMAMLAELLKSLRKAAEAEVAANG